MKEVGINLHKKIISLTTYGTEEHTDIEFMVSEKWLKENVDMPLNEFLESYTFDDSQTIFCLAKKQNQIIEEKEIEAEI